MRKNKKRFAWAVVSKTDKGSVAEEGKLLLVFSSRSEARNRRYPSSEKVVKVALSQVGRG